MRVSGLVQCYVHGGIRGDAAPEALLQLGPVFRHEMREMIRRRNENRPEFAIDAPQHIQDRGLHVVRLGDEEFVAVPGEADGFPRVERDDDCGDPSGGQAADRPQTDGVRAENDRPRSTHRGIRSVRREGRLPLAARRERDRSRQDR